MTNLIISSNCENISFIEQCLKENTAGLIVTANSGNEARRLISGDTKPDLVIIDTPLSDEFGQELAEITAITSVGVILICRNDIYENISHNLSQNVIILTKPFSREDFRNAVESFPETSGIKPESSDILTKIEEMRLINRAKCTLMEYLDFTEPQAHRYIEKQAMNNRRTRRETAEKILDTYKK
ncbi:MAG: ANTAR domain-containing protein [Prevotella sp.]|nr:ANTAR domain-containing protein [Alistipes senegalensis]MCM1358337.1 ANTAR domain-containing protein [Prevotella sp.]MCM1473083.1 ANTAR domain-containing protein [Muribaculaceae bacterium]